jgi:predicted nucleotide-binding protein
MTDENETRKSIMPSAAIGLPAAEEVDYDSALDGIASSMEEALQAMVFLNVPAAMAAAQKADAHFFSIRPNREPKYLLLTSLRALTHIYSLTAIFMQQVAEMAIKEAYSTCDQSADAGREGEAALNALFDADPQAKQVPEIARLRDVFSTLVIANESGRKALEAQEALYRGDPDTYLKKLAEASASFRRVRNLEPSLEPTIIALKQQQISMADRLDRQAKNYRLDLYVDPVDRFIPVTGKKVLIIHGHAEARWRELRDLLRSWGIETIVLWEEVSAGQTIIEKFQEYANQCCFAFSLVTPDDIIQKDEELYGQARPNVIFETGWFFGRFGPRRVGIIAKEDTMLPSDLSGIVTFRFSRKVTEESEAIRRSLKALGVPPDS